MTKPISILLAVALTAFAATLVEAEDPLLPLHDGNYWIYDGVTDSASAEIGRWSQAMRIDVHGPVTVATPADTVFSTTQEGYVLSGTSYFRVSSDRRVPWLGSGQDTILVRNATTNTVVLGGYTKGGRLYVIPEQVWLSTEHPMPYYVSGSPYDSFFLEMEIFIRQIFDARDGDQERWVFDYDGESSLQWSKIRLSKIAGRFAPGLTGNLVDFHASTSRSHHAVGATLLRGVGPLVFPNGWFEYKVFHYELNEAFVNGSVVQPASTGVDNATYGQLKARHLE